MAQAEPSNVMASCGGEHGGTGTVPVGEAHSGVAGDEYATALASTSSSAQCSEYVTAGMSEQQISALIKTSREQGTWSELKDGARDGAAECSHAGINAAIWEELKERDPRIFRDFSEDQLQLGRVIAEGGQATIYEAKYYWHDKWDFVAKVFKMEGFSLADLQRHWPRATKAPTNSELDENFVLGGVVFGESIARCHSIYWGTFLKDGRFAFVTPRRWGDLRTLINLKLKDKNSEGPPFSYAEAVYIMHDIAMGMGELHERGVLHRDLKAANVLVWGSPSRVGLLYMVADFESSMLVQGTGFWRAPEILKELLKTPHDRDKGIWTEKVDIYSYAMTCYEVLTGFIPFPGYEKSDWKRVIDGERPHFPGFVDPTLQELVERCWDAEPSKRPGFEVIRVELGCLKDVCWKMR